MFGTAFAAVGLAAITAASPAPPPFGISANAFHIYTKPHHSYVVKITNTGRETITVKSGMATVKQTGRTCGVNLRGQVTWAHLSPASFTLRPHRVERVRLAVGTPPPGKTIAVATFIGHTFTRSRTRGAGATAAGGVGLSIYSNRPGHARTAFCHPGKKAAPGAAAFTTTTPTPPWVLGAIGGIALALIITAAYIRRVIRRRNPPRRRKGGGPEPWPQPRSHRA